MLQRNDAEYVIEVRGVQIRAQNVDRVVEIVRNLTLAETPAAPKPANLGDAVARVFADGMWRTPTEVIEALQRAGVRASDATYNRVYATLRYGEYVKRGQKWNLREAA